MIKFRKNALKNKKGKMGDIFQRVKG